MHRLRFKEWLSTSSPEGAGEIWDNRSNADLDFGRTGAKSKNVASDSKTGQAEFDPEQLFLGRKGKKQVSKLDKSDILGGNHGSS